MDDIVTSTLHVQTFLVALLIFLALYWWKKSSSRALPPGPLQVPILGSLPFLLGDIREALMRLKGKYGGVCTVRLGANEAIVLNGYEAIREAFVKQGKYFAGRPHNLFFFESFSKDNGIFGSQGALWQDNRKLAHRILREIGMGRNVLEDKIIEEIGHFLDTLERKSRDGPIDLQFMMLRSVSNVIFSMLFGRRFDYENPTFKRYIEKINEFFSYLGTGGALAALPWLKYLPGDYFGIKKLKRYNVDMKNQMEDWLETHKKNINKVKDPSNFVDMYLLHGRRLMEEGKHNPFTDYQLYVSVCDLLSAGTETTATVLRWALLYMIQHPEYQKRVQEEIDEHIKEGSPPSMANKTQMPFTEACILETLRLGDIVPLGVPHACLEDAELFGYTVPKGIWVIPNIYSVHRDPELWEKPYEFNPHHFLTESGQVQRKECLIPFSMGKRVCLGESLARMEIFLFFTSLLQRFSFSLAEGEKMPGIDGIVAASHMPHPHKLQIERRIPAFE